VKYAFAVLSDPTSPFFSSLCYFLARRIDERTRAQLLEGVCFSDLVSTTINVDAVLVLACAMLEGNAIENFLASGGHNLFRAAIESGVTQNIAAALQFAVGLPKTALSAIEWSVGPALDAVDRLGAAALEYLVQMLARFPADVVGPYAPAVAKAIIRVAESIQSQATVTVVALLFPLSRAHLTPEALTICHSFLSRDFIVPASFVSTLLATGDADSYPLLLLNAFKASQRADLKGVLIEHLQKCENRRVFQTIAQVPDFAPVIARSLECAPVPALFLLFCLAQDDPSPFRGDSPILSALLQMKDHNAHRLQILTILCRSEPFCIQTPFSEGILQLVVASLAVPRLADAAHRLIAALADHRTGCFLMADHGVVILFVQRRLTAGCNDPIVHAIFRRITRNNVEVPQGPLVVSCLTQDLFARRGSVVEILRTVASIVAILPGSIQEHDVHRIISSFLRDESPPVINAALQLLAMVDASMLRPRACQILAATARIFAARSLFVELVLSAVDVLLLIQQFQEVREGLERMEFNRFLTECLAFIPEDDESAMRLEQARDAMQSLGTRVGGADAMIRLSI
jgi:hypothetical protein